MKEDNATLTLADLAGRTTVSVEEAAAMLGYSRNWAYRMIREGEFPAKTIHPGNRIRVLAGSLHSLLTTGEG